MEFWPPDRGGLGVSRRALLGPTLAVVLLTAGCSGVVGSDGPPGTTAEPAGTDEPEQTTGDSHSHTHAGESTNQTTTANETTTGAPTETNAGGTNATGRMTVVVAGEEVTGDATFDSERVRFVDEEPHTWRTSGDVTLRSALSMLGVEVSGETVTYGGTTYDGAARDTSVHLRVDGDPVDDPSAYTLSDGDEVWVTVETEAMNVSTPGQYIQRDDQHVHGGMEFVVDGEQVDFEGDRYQTNDRYFHFEDGDGSLWHAHSYSITLQYALSSLDGIDVDADGSTVTFDGTTYRAGESGTTITVEVNGEPVEPGEYYLKDGDEVRVVVDTG